jgi:nucleoside-diphosphate-sugar epimerase
MPADAILITGPNGYLGRRVTERLLAETDSPLWLWLHAESAEMFAQKRDTLLEAFASEAHRLHFAGGRFEDEKPLGEIPSGEIRLILHTAADTRFNIEREVAEAVNVRGTEKLVDYARTCPHLERFCYVSTVYVAGLRRGVIPEAPLEDRPGFANHYEWSKWTGESRLQAVGDDFPWTCLRVATVIADNLAGRVTQYNAFHNTLKLLYYGLLSLLPGHAHTPLSFVTGDFVAEALTQLVETAPPGSFYHLCHEAEATATLGDLVEVAYTVFESDPDFQQRRLLRPLFCDEASFKLMTQAVHGFGGDIVNQAMGSVAPFARQLFLPKTFTNKGLQAALPGYAASDPRQLIRHTCQYLVQTKWGRLHATAP